jgi:hypothetical protein
MITRTCQANVQFSHPFQMPGLDGPQPAGIYRLTTDQEQMCGISFVTYRTILAFLELPAQGSPALAMRQVPIDIDDLEACICADRQAMALLRLAAPVA